MKFEKNEEYYAQLDKRTKEYKEYQEFKAEQVTGLGDVIAMVTKATGIDKVADSIAHALGYEDCGCDERKEKLNQLYGFKGLECLTEEEFVYLVDFFALKKTRVTYPEQLELYKIYNRIFHAAMKPTSCGSCYREVANKLSRLVTEYKK